MISFQDKISVVKEIFKKLYAVVDSVALLFPCRPVELRPHQSFTEEPNYSQLVIGDHVEVSTDTIVRCVSLQDRSGRVL